MTNTPWNISVRDDWRERVAALSMQRRMVLAERALTAPLFAHAYSFHLNMRFGGMTPHQLAEFSYAKKFSGLKIHVDDGESASLGKMSDDELLKFADQMSAFGLDLHIETSATEEQELADAVRIALATGATSLRCYPRYEGRISEIIRRTIEDLKRLPVFDSGSRLRYTLEQHEDLKSDELVHILEAVGNPQLSLLFDFGNMTNAYELPLAALATQSPYITEVHVKDCIVKPDRGGWAHLACASGEGNLPMYAMLVELLLLGNEKPQVSAFGLEEEEGYFAPALRFPSEDPDPFIPARTASFTHIEAADIPMRMRRETEAAHRQVDFVRSILREIAVAAAGV